MTDRKPTCVACKGAGGANYTAGTGIVIESNEISADTSVLATKSELPDMDDYQPKLTEGNGIDITSDVISIDESKINFNREYTLVDFDTFIADFCYESDNKYYLKQSVLLSFNWGGEISGTYNTLANRVALVIAKNTLIKDGNSNVSIPPIMGLHISSGNVYISSSLGYSAIFNSTNPKAQLINDHTTLLQSGWTNVRKALRIYY